MLRGQVCSSKGKRARNIGQEATKETLIMMIIMGLLDCYHLGWWLFRGFIWSWKYYAGELWWKPARCLIVQKLAGCIWRRLIFRSKSSKVLDWRWGIEIYDCLKIIEHKACLWTCVFVMSFSLHIRFWSNLKKFTFFLYVAPRQLHGGDLLWPHLVSPGLFQSRHCLGPKK